ncbi:MULTISPECIES: peptidyl-tRNA hydrolase [unclassified Saccharopolyspora]|uniref:peptidyl-tRNA hydrolase n=1 Tax=unclassified Saccharopolyspora TaxID=2646250 RepID=UPI001CD6DFA5|nr:MULTISPECIES: peptidyl-tRNA hydrolase [unclassified Saccharopolyspora]MCA1194081.1 peptidyl-tRNA hydrolase [Saccharopolyspora sp. 6V]MCA1227492.1 peptidyl-tRNA hydrolase [Saccharopolyspora sp. 6M]MCA1281033.1 peptidyl-tRNA hydrolase [Saccharopolyspora sp. 7B]
MPDVLDPLLTRYASWLAMPTEATADTSDEDPDEVVLMPMVLRIERGTPPGRTALLEAAASAALAVCLDERAEPGGEWHEQLHRWTSGRIRKVSRRARGAHWAAVQDLPGRTVEVDGAEVRAFLPSRVADMPKELTRLQISGSELDADEPGPPRPDAPVLWLNPHVPMSAGKSAAQVGHATMFLAALLHGEGRAHEVARWSAAGLPCSVRTADPATWARLLPGDDAETAWRRDGVAAVRDAGFTEVDPGTVTVLGQWR